MILKSKSLIHISTILQSAAWKKDKLLNERLGISSSSEDDKKRVR